MGSAISCDDDQVRSASGTSAVNERSQAEKGVLREGTTGAFHAAARSVTTQGPSNDPPPRRPYRRRYSGSGSLDPRELARRGSGAVSPGQRCPDTRTRRRWWSGLH